MLRDRLKPILIIAAVACLGAPIGCGSTSNAGLLSPTQANSVNGALDSVDEAVAAGDCEAAASASDRLRQIVGSLPGSVDVALRGSLIDGAGKVASLAATDCAKRSTSTTSSSTSTSSSTTSSSTTSSSTTSSSTTTTEPTTTTPTTPTTTTPTTTGGGGAGPEG